ncbi:MAG: ATP-binding cassette domain-containing protein, partial [Tissierellia bacterium]|nr:ATP-binding cassette domain-containing protein [Tissierellia bacterium]
MIKISNARKNYCDKVRIGPLNIEIPKAGVTSLIGPNGAGKSTTLLMIGRLLDMDEGSIQVANMDVSKTKSEDLAKVLTILRQENHFITRLTVRQLVGFGRFPYSKGRLTKEDEMIISKYIDFFELRELENRYLDELSGGQRQRAYVAMVLCQETEYVLLDEPLNNLDVARSVQMMEHLRRAADEFGRTILVVIHDINFAAKYSDRICAMKDGQIAAFGRVEEVMD